VSVSALTTLAAVRDKRGPTKQDVGKSSSADAAGNEPASLSDMLASQVPTELVAPYTAVTAAIVGAVDKPTKNNLHPDQLAAWRWLAFSIMIAVTVALVWEGKRRKSSLGTVRTFPLLEVTAALVAAVGWAFALPGSPLIPYLNGKAEILTPIVVAFAAVVISVVIAGALQAPRRSAKTSGGTAG
jgi:uncharacterized membrane protein